MIKNPYLLIVILAAIFPYWCLALKVKILNIRKIIIVLFSLLAISNLPAQTNQSNPCPTDNLNYYPGAWKPFSGYWGGRPINAKPGSYDKTAADAALDKLLALAKKAYPQPAGGNANFTKYLAFSNVDDFLPFGYWLYIGHPGFVCTVGDKITETFETGVYLTFHINTYESFAQPVDAPEVPQSKVRLGLMKGSESGYSINGQRVFYIHENFVSTNGWMDHYTEKIYAEEEPRRQWYIIRKENVPLFRYVTRREYLEQFREEIREYRAEYIRIVQDYYNKYPEYGREQYDQIPDFEKKAEKVVRLVDEYLQNNSEAELSKPVSEMINHTMILFMDEPEIKFREDRFHLAYFNEDYLYKKLPHHIPQFMVIELSGPAHDKTGRFAWKYNFRKSMQEGLDFVEIYKLISGKPPVNTQIQLATNKTVKPAAPSPVTPVATATTATSSSVNTPSLPAPSSHSLQPDKLQHASDHTQIPVYDLDGNKYDVIQIGSQFWLKQNLRTTQYRDTTPIANGLNAEHWKTTFSGAYIVYENNDKHEKTYGKLYNGYAISTGKLCPEGWHVPTDDEWKTLEEHLGIPNEEIRWTGGRGSVGGKLKAAELWKPAAITTNNSTGFSALPAGNRSENGDFDNMGQFNGFWTGTTYETSDNHMWYRHLYYHTNEVGRLYTKKNNGFSVRCVKN
jgi:uncharacterized protein (TIGR02145 family)